MCNFFFSIYLIKMKRLNQHTILCKKNKFIPILLYIVGVVAYNRGFDVGFKTPYVVIYTVTMFVYYTRNVYLVVSDP